MVQICVCEILYLTVTGSLTLLCTNPIWIAKTRLCLQYEAHGATYKGMLNAITDLYKQNGIRGLYKVSYTVNITKFCLPKSCGSTFLQMFKPLTLLSLLLF